MPAMYTHFTHDFDSCETEMEEFPKVWGRIYFDECPDNYRESNRDSNGPFGIVRHVNYANNFVKVVIGKDKEIEFDLDGSSWSKCGRFKREQWEYQGEIETCVCEE